MSIDWIHFYTHGYIRISTSTVNLISLQVYLNHEIRVRKEGTEEIYTIVYMTFIFHHPYEE